MKRVLALAVLLLCSRAVHAQGAAYTAGPFNVSGLFYVCPVPSGGTPCPAPSSIFATVALITQLSNPILIPQGQTVSFFVTPGQYTVQFPASGYSKIETIGGSSGFTSLTAGTNSNVGTFQWSQAGVFTNSAMNETVWSTLNSCSPSNIWGDGSTPAYFLTDALSGCVAVPTGSAVGFSNGVAGYAQVNDSGATGALGFGAGVGVFGAGFCNVSNAHCWGQNDVVNDKTGNSNNFIFGNEADIGIRNTTTQTYGLLSLAYFAAQPSGTAVAVDVSAKTGNNCFGGTCNGAWNAGLQCEVAALNTANPFCLNILAQGTGNDQSSQVLRYAAADHVGATSSQFYLFARDIHVLQNFPVMSWRNAATGSEGFVIAITATNNTAYATLVKIDTANADSVVSCTTADTVCHGFVMNHNGITQDCGAGQTFCGVAMGSGQLAQGILGTGTCAIGNFVIVDTTTNGRIKCTATTPGAGAEMGIALSAQSTVGNLVDVLTKFQ